MLFLMEFVKNIWFFVRAGRFNGQFWGGESAVVKFISVYLGGFDGQEQVERWEFGQNEAVFFIFLFFVSLSLGNIEVIKKGGESALFYILLFQKCHSLLNKCHYKRLLS